MDGKEKKFKTFDADKKIADFLSKYGIDPAKLPEVRKFTNEQNRLSFGIIQTRV